ncbi:probable caffeoyl-CoA O-methyltransferase 1 [Watersipora subatra]|uniref:probable caffeoyl-CoA O-methyltransferase 1 n=1 Tax=Watersipora subatra TaxID=2589382 RepID=UPI00355AF39A
MMAEFTSKKPQHSGSPTTAHDYYFLSNVSKLHPCQKKLIELTKLESHPTMLAGYEGVTLLCNMLQFAGAKRCIDIGVFTGYSSLSWALHIPDDGKVVSCDVSETWPQVGIPIWKEAGVDHKIHLKIAEAATTLQGLIDEGESGTYDFVFIDADKDNYDRYYEFALKLLRPNGIIAIDNAFWHGKVLNAEDTSASTTTIRDLNLKIKDDSRVTAVLIDISDGIYVCRKLPQ